MGSPGSADPRGSRTGTWSISRYPRVTLLATTSCGVPGLCRDQQVARPRASAQNQSRRFQVLPPPICRGCKGGRRGALSQSSSQAPSNPMPNSVSWGQERRLILPSVIEEGRPAFSLMRAWASWGDMVCSIFGFLLSTLTGKFISVFFRNFSIFFSAEGLINFNIELCE